MPTLFDVWRAVFPAALAASDPPSRDVGWVRVLKPRVPAFDALEAGDLAILPARVMAELAESSGVDPSGVVDAVARVGGAGVLVVGSDGGAAAALDHAVAVELGSFSLQEGDVPSLERSVIGYLVNSRAELERQAQALEAQLERLALDGRDLDAFTAAIAGFLGRGVAIEQPRGRPLSVHAPANVPAAAQGAAAYLAQPRRVALRIRLPDTAEPAAALVLLGVARPSELDRTVGQRVAGLLALELRRGPGAPPRGRSPAVSAALPTAGPPWVAVVARQVIPSQPTSPEERESIRRQVRDLEPAARLLLRGDSASLELRVIAAVDTGDPRGLRLAERIARVVGRPVAVSRPFAGRDDRAFAEAEARGTMEAAESIREAGGGSPVAEAGGASVSQADLLPAYRLLSAVNELADGERQARTLLAPLLSGSREAANERLLTLRAILDARGPAEAARALGIHRNTLSYRTARLEARTGWRLADPSLRFALAIAVRLVQTAQEEPDLRS